jgi:hypothetical protein
MLMIQFKTFEKNEKFENIIKQKMKKFSPTKGWI